MNSKASKKASKTVERDTEKRQSSTNNPAYHCPICQAQFHSNTACSLHHRSCLFKANYQKTTPTSNNSSILHESLLQGRNQSISVLNRGMIQNDIIPLERYAHKRQRLGINELNNQFEAVINNPFDHQQQTQDQTSSSSSYVSNSENLQHNNSNVYNEDSDGAAYAHLNQSSMSHEETLNNNGSNSSVASNQSSTSSYTNEELEQQMRLLDLEEVNINNAARGFTNDYIVGFNLMKILNKANSPLYLYDEIMRWATESRLTHSYDFQNNAGASSREKLKKFAFESSSSKHLKPIPKYVNIGPNKKNSVEVITFDTVGMIHSLLSDPNLMKDENLLFEGDSPYPNIDPTTGLMQLSHILGDVNTGVWYKKACETLCEKEIDVVCPILMFIDGLTIDEYSNIQIEPVTFTLGIFNRATRNKAEAWKTLGFINNLNHHDTYIDDSNDDQQSSQSVGGMTSLQKLTDYHTILDTILEDLRQIQESGGLLWNLEYKGKTFKVRFKFPIQFVVGDCKGHNLLCGRFGSHNNTNSLCRDCDVLLKKSDDPNVTCKRIKEDKIQHLINTNDTVKLKKLSFHNLKNNAFRDICFGGDPCGIYGATLPELLHVLRITLTSHAITAFTDRSSQRNIDTLHVISKKLGLHGAKQSDRSFFKIKFSQAITDLAKLDGDHKLGSVFLLFLSLYSSCGLINFCSDYSNLKLILPAVEQLLIFHEWAMAEEHPILDLFECDINEETADKIENAQFNIYGKSPAYKATKRMMESYKMGVQRSKGNGFQFPKFHQLLHSILNILRHGSMRNFDGARCEGIGKTNAKEPSRRTQRNTKTVLEQTGMRYIENCIFDKCISDIQVHLKNFGISDESKTTPKKNDNTSRKDYCNLQGSCYTIYIDEVQNDREHLVLEWMSEKTVILDYGQALNAAQFAFNYLKIGLPDSDLNTQELTFKTEYISDDGHLYRSHPSYRSEGPWHDWVLVNWEVDNENGEDDEVESNVIPGRIYGMFEITEDMLKENSEDIQTGVWFVISSLCLEPIDNSDSLPPNVVQQCFLDNISIAKKWKIDYASKGVLRFWLVHADNVVSPAFVVPDINKDIQICQEYVIVVKPRSEWKDLFIKQSDRHM